MESPQKSPRHRERASRDASTATAFSLVEVVLAVGIIGFSLLAIVGLLPTGLRTQQLSNEEARAASALNMVASAAESLRTTTSSGGDTTWAFPAYFSDDSSNPLVVSVGQAAWTSTFFVSDGGMIIRSNDTVTRPRQTLFLRVYPPQLEGQPVRIYAAVTWPHKPSDTASTGLSDMTGRQGFLDTLVAYTPNPTF
ncbi:MAG: hypothetical protein H0U23_01935 [Blastocatellia bacterium]|nr:hypothetical protein [Blastocatellia bacterium]